MTKYESIVTNSITVTLAFASYYVDSGYSFTTNDMVVDSFNNHGKVEGKEGMFS